MKGATGRDRLKGARGSDRLNGGPQNDRLLSKDGSRDAVSGGSGKDFATADRVDAVRKVERGMGAPPKKKKG